MPNRKTRRAQQSNKDKGKQFGTITKTMLAGLIDAKGRVDVAEAKHKAEGAAFDLLFAEATASVKAVKEASLICLTCGTVYERGSKGCPKCQ